MALPVYILCSRWVSSNDHARAMGLQGIRMAQSPRKYRGHVHGNNIWRTSFVRFLVFDAPGADCVTNVAASEFDLGVIAHSGQRYVM